MAIHCPADFGVGTNLEDKLVVLNNGPSGGNEHPSRLRFCAASHLIHVMNKTLVF